MCAEHLLKSQSLNTDQGNSDPIRSTSRSTTMPMRLNPSIQIRAIRTEQKGLENAGTYDESQSLNTDQGNSDKEGFVHTPGYHCSRVSIPQYRSGQFGLELYTLEKLAAAFVSIPQYRSGQFGPRIRGSSRPGGPYHVSIPQYRSGQFGRNYRSCAIHRSRRVLRVSIPQYRSGQFGLDNLVSNKEIYNVLSQSLNTDQGNSDPPLARP